VTPYRQNLKKKKMKRQQVVRILDEKSFDDSEAKWNERVKNTRAD